MAGGCALHRDAVCAKSRLVSELVSKLVAAAVVVAAAAAAV